MIGDPWGAFGRDLGDAARDIGDASTPVREVSEQLAGELAEQAPVLTGFLAGSAYADDQGAGMTAEYAAIVAARDPYPERALASVDWETPFVNHIEDALSSNLRLIYA